MSPSQVLCRLTGKLESLFPPERVDSLTEHDRWHNERAVALAELLGGHDCVPMVSVLRGAIRARLSRL
jgi:hypothetical protein